MDVEKNSSSMICSQHNEQHRAICFGCSRLMCSRCIVTHNKIHPDHCQLCEHIDDIKESLNNIKEVNEESLTENNNDNDINNDSDQHSTFINKRLDSIWKSLRSSTTKYKRLKLVESEISKHFEQIHQYLIIEEHSLKKPIISDLDFIGKQIQSNVDEVKHINNIIEIYNYNHNDDEEMQCNSQESDIEQSTDTADSYSLASIVDSISNNSSLQSFIDDNRTTIFDQHNSDLLKELLKQHNNDTTSLLFDIIQKYSNQFRSIYTANTTNNDQHTDLKNNNEYQLCVTIPNYDKLIDVVHQSIKTLATSMAANGVIVEGHNEYSSLTELERKEKNKSINQVIKTTPLNLDDRWYLICKPWYDKWESNIYTTEHLGPIINDTLLITDTTHLRLNAIVDQDFVVVPESTWDYFLKSYDCPTIIVRTVVGTEILLQIDYNYPKCLKFFKSSQPARIIEHYVTNSEKISAVKDKVCKLFNIHPENVRVWDYYHNNKFKELNNDEKVANSNLFEDQLMKFSNNVVLLPFRRRTIKFNVETKSNT
ncbi:peptidase C19 family protein [Heterostelium album PN500]|uniref:Peptidase C19 family protein n=1 Tax=Heterostelium pallidum (strain ATCC 26659 / Pp 5 / PN500) TaxID=670386 RepID=D3BTB2_HETP5|nr:peptidase C19 family protein [Heterostelium album PN500]EFA75329.1 peptidase C19 family protein [Heterostelium album PN500]|eukprot:XP_020427463.1 peptidase C19 family protein [Heterostelium album PN500]